MERPNYPHIYYIKDSHSPSLSPNPSHQSLSQQLAKPLSSPSFSQPPSPKSIPPKIHSSSPYSISIQTLATTTFNPSPLFFIKHGSSTIERATVSTL